jgi:hypothetical protein
MRARLLIAPLVVVVALLAGSVSSAQAMPRRSAELTVSYEVQRQYWWTRSSPVSVSCSLTSPWWWPRDDYSCSYVVQTRGEAGSAYVYGNSVRVYRPWRWSWRTRRWE